MKNAKFLKKTLIAVLALVMVFAMSTNAFAEQGDRTNVDVYLTVERTLLSNQNPILEPIKVTVPAGSTVIDVLTKVKTDLGASTFDFGYTGNTANGTAYVTKFKVPSHAPFNYLTDYEFWTQYDAAANGMGNVYFDYGQIPGSSDFWLEQSDYNMLGGWIVSANDVITWDDPATSNTNEAYPTASTVVQNNQVFRFHYSMALARDCGFTGWSLLTLQDLEPPFYTKADKTILVRNMANHVNKTSSAYLNALAVLKDMDATQQSVNAAASQL